MKSKINAFQLLEQIDHEAYSALFYTPVLYKDAKSYIFKNPQFILTADNNEELEELFIKAEEYKHQGYISYAYFKYETGYLLEPYFNDLTGFQNLSGLINSQSTILHDLSPLSKICVFKSKDVQIIDSCDLDFSDSKKMLLEDHFKINNFKLNTERREFIENINKIRAFILKGDTYQVNYTVKSYFDFEGSLSALFLKLIFLQSGKYNAFINDNGNYILSLSPELFFERVGGKIICKPMKGTEKRGKDYDSDLTNCNLLKNSIKNRSENVMIVDLLRNDLSRLSEISELKYAPLFEIEKFETLFQMTSTIEVSLHSEIESCKDLKLSGIFKSIFPCGSITGAPKIRTMEIISEIEKEPRGIYTGALGIISPERDIFSVPIRTLNIDSITGKGCMGVGSGIVWDSVAEEEYNETILKSSFLTDNTDYFELFETMLVENNNIFLLREHLDRLRKAADYFLFLFNEENIIKAINESLKSIELSSKYRLKLTIDKWGNIVVELSALDIQQVLTDYKLALSDIRVSSENKFQYFKTTNRTLYEREFLKYKQIGYDEVLFFNERNELTEGSRTNIFIEKNGIWLTPKLSCGLLNGIYRQYFINNHPDCIETVLYKNDLFNADKIILTNALRKEITIKRHGIS